MNLEGRQIDHLAPFQSFFGLRDVNGCVILGVFLLELREDLVLERMHVVLHHFADCNLISDVVEHAWELGVMYEFLLLESDQQILLLWRQELGASNHILEVLEVARALLHIVQFLEFLLKEPVSLHNLIPKDELQCLWFRLFHVHFLFTHVAHVNCLDGVDTNRNKLSPVDLFILIFVC